MLSTRGSKSSITSTCLGYKYAVFVNRSVKALSSKSTPQISWYSLAVTVLGSTVEARALEVRTVGRALDLTEVEAVEAGRWGRKDWGVNALIDPTEAVMTAAKAVFGDVIMVR